MTARCERPAWVRGIGEEDVNFRRWHFHASDRGGPVCGNKRAELFGYFEVSSAPPDEERCRNCRRKEGSARAALKKLEAPHE